MRGTTRASISGTATWPAWVPGRSTHTGWTGSFDPTGTGLRFNPNKVLIDPYALGNIDNLWDRNSAVGPQDNVATAMRSVVIDPTTYDWEGDEPLHIPIKDSIIYEMHVRGFTMSPTSGVVHPGTLRDDREDPVPQGARRHRGRAASVFAFDEREVRGINPIDGSSCGTSGATTPTSTSRPNRATASARRRARTSPSSATWSRRSTRPGSR